MNKLKVVAAVAGIAAVAGVYWMTDKPTALGPVDAPVAPAKIAQAEAKEKAPVAAPKLDDNRVYVMYVDTCPMCAQALEYINGKYADNAAVVKVDLNTAEGKELLKACRKKFGFKDIVIPLICAKEGYTMGWSEAMSAKLDGYIQAVAE